MCVGGVGAVCGARGTTADGHGKLAGSFGDALPLVPVWGARSSDETVAA